MIGARPGPDPAHLDFPSLGAALLHWADTRGGEAAVILLADGERESERLTYADLAGSALGLAATLAAEGLAGRPLLLPAQTSASFVRGLYAAFLAGAIAVPVSTQLRGAAADRLRSIAGSCRAAALLEAPGSEAVAEVLPDLRRIGCDGAGAAASGRAANQADRVALLQYTSGSTAEPRGVMIGAGNLSRNAEMARRAYRVRGGSRMLSWLPLFHDMGLMSLMMPLWAGITTVLIPPLAFLQRPQRWPIAIDRHGATISGGPNFAFDLCAARAPAALAAGIDLSNWDLAFCGSEPVRRPTLHRFAHAYAAAGFRPEALYPCYGLAEATVYVAGGHWDPAAPDGPVSCGRIADGTTVRIVADASAGELAGDGATGEIWLRGPQVGLGYWQDRDATEETFGAVLPGDHQAERHLRTGDIGMIAAGELYVLGRTKDVLIHRGANIHAADVETCASASDPALNGAPSAVFAVELGERDGVVLVHEVNRRSIRGVDPSALVRAIEDAVARDYGLRLLDLLLVRPGTLPRTASGKVRRSEVRRRYLAGELAAARLDAGAPPDDPGARAP